MNIISCVLRLVNDFIARHHVELNRLQHVWHWSTAGQRAPTNRNDPFLKRVETRVRWDWKVRDERGCNLGVAFADQLDQRNIVSDSAILVERVLDNLLELVNGCVLAFVAR